MTRELRYAATTVDVTPPTNVPLAGYTARDAVPATGTHDRLTASLLWLSGANDDSSVCWVAVDALGLDVSAASRIRTAVAARIGTDVDAVLVCSSHTHSGPVTWSDASSGAAIDRLVKDISRGAARLPAIRTSVTAAWCTVPDVGVGANRYDPAGPHDASTGVLVLRDAEQAVVTVLFDYACHPTVLGHTNLEYSADYPAATRRVVRAALQETDGVETPPVVVFLQGAAGDASTRFTRRAATFAEADRQGAILAGSLLRGVLAAEPLAGREVVVLRGTCTVPTRSLPTAAVIRKTLAAAEQAWAKLDPGDGPETPEIRIARTRREGALTLAAMREAKLPASYDLPISVVAIGDVAWAHLPVEPITCFGEQIRAASPFGQTRTIGYTDGYFGYLADEQAHRAGQYEALSSVFGPAAGEVVVREAVALLHKAHAAVGGKVVG
ncbi:MAG TPA: hypothetical protein VH333_10535 [Pseudonocardiaceae bacterium]|jgi:hypothetical protein|nr:hypothetical protein [Pseudonocardiaceae bacterium]